MYLSHGALCIQETNPLHFPAPDQLLKEFGAEAIRLWMLLQKPSQDLQLNYESLVSTSQTILKKLRNTLWFLLANLSDFQPQQDSLAFEKLAPTDQFIQQKLTLEFQAIQNDYESYELSQMCSARSTLFVTKN